MVKQKYAAFELGNDIVAVAESISTQQTMITVIIIMFLWPHQAHTHTHGDMWRRQARDSTFDFQCVASAAHQRKI